MDQRQKNFRHQSLQDSESIQEMLEAVCKGLARGRLKFSDDADEVVLKPRGLLDFQVVASSDDTEDEVSIKISWRRDSARPKQKTLKVSSK